MRAGFTNYGNATTCSARCRFGRPAFASRRRLQLRSVLLASIFILCSTRIASAQLALKACGLSGERIQCGTLTVLENRLAPSGRHLLLNLFVLPHTGSGPSREPVFILKGGPGEAATANVEDLARSLRALRAEHDVVLLDQRGTAGTHRLNCEVADRRFLVPRDPGKCLARLSAQADLRMYSTAQFVEDLETARSTLGYQQISLYGGSYGTRAAYEYARKHPSRVRSVVLVSPAPSSMRVLDSFEGDGRRALTALIMDCSSNRSCAKAFPDFAAQLNEVAEQLKDPYHVLGIQFLQYSSATLRYIPLLVSEAAHGRREPLDRAIADVRSSFIAQLSIGLNLAVFCSEELPRSNAAHVSPLRLEYQIACAGWPRAEVSTDAAASNKLIPPALIVFGEFDPVTSARWAKVMADQFRESRILVIPREAHVFGSAMSQCIGSVAANFLARRPLSAECAARQAKWTYALRIP